jgi:hypothetical protein
MTGRRRRHNGRRMRVVACMWRCATLPGRIPTALAVALVLLAGCAAAPPAVQPREPEPARARAALASVFVENRTAERIAIAYRLTTRAGAEVVVGHADPGTTIELAPLPAGEPVILIARTQAGGELVLAARSFMLGTAWTWLVPADAQFQPPPEDH